MKSMMIVLLIIGGIFYYMNEKSTKEESDEPSAMQQEKSKPKGVIPQYQLDALKKAKNVENVLKDAAKKQDERLQ